MHEQNFEKQVQQKMEELSLTPSAPVWQKVEGQIRKKRTDWWQALWLVALLLVIGSAYWLLSGTEVKAPSTASNKGTLTTTAVPQPSSSTPAATGNHTEKTAIPPEPGNMTTGAQSPAPEVKSLSISNTSNTNNTTRINSAATAPGNTIPTVHDKIRAMVQNKLIAKPSKKAIAPNQESLGREKQTMPLTLPGQLVANQKEIAASEALSTISQFTTDSTSTTVADLVSKQEDTTTQTASLAPIQTPTTDSAAIAYKAPGKKIRKWQWAVHAQAGISSLQSTLFQLPSARSVYSSPAQSGSGNFFFYTPSPVTDGAGYAAGVTLKRLVNDRLRLTAGVQYNYYSTKREVGQEVRRDTLITYSTGVQKINNYYRAGTQNTYRNQYHFIQLPVGIEYQVLRKLPVQIHTGVSFARLMSTNTLLYDYSLQIYHENSDVFSKNQWHLFSNITYTLWQGKTKALQVGPYAQYSITELQKNAPEKNRLFSAGLRSQLSF